MLILPPGHAQAVRARRQLAPREKWMIGAVLGVTAALVLAAVFSFAAGRRHTGHGCVYIDNIAAFTGGQEIYDCGQVARQLCQSVGAPGGFRGEAGRSVATQCRIVHLPVGINGTG
ncbi:MAG: hypothetical protein ACYC91_08360 [Solirubrobacteraceae bacterium]